MSERSGNLKSAIDKIIRHHREINELKKKFKKSLIYPCVVFCTTLIIAILILSFVVPNFEKLYNSFHVPLPTLTHIIICISNGLHKFHWIIMISIVIAIIVVKVFRRNIRLKEKFQVLFHKIPIIKDIIRKVTLHYLYHYMAEMISANMPILTILELIQQTSIFSIYHKRLKTASMDLLKGAPLYHTLETTKLIEKDDAEIIRIAEQTGQLVKILKALEEQYHEKCMCLHEYLSKVLEPMIMLFVSLLIGTVVIALYWPTFNLGLLF